MTDIVERLRAASHDERLSTGMLYREAADEIERLRKALRRICEPLTVTGDSDSSSACRDLHDLICAIAQAALRRKA